jgi:hypothetical protein
LYKFGSWEEEVSGTPDGFEIPWPFGIIIEFMAQATDRHVDGSIVRVPIDSANTLHNLISIHDPPGMVKKECQDFKFGRGEIKYGAVQRPILCDFGITAGDPAAKLTQRQSHSHRPAESTYR